MKRKVVEFEAVEMLEKEKPLDATHLWESCFLSGYVESERPILKKVAWESPGVRLQRPVSP